MKKNFYDEMKTFEKEQKIKQLLSMLSFIENEENYYAMFSYVLQSAERCTQELQNLLNAGIITFEEKSNYSSRVDAAKRKAIETHLAWTVKRLSENKNHTVETVVYSVYNDIFPGYVPKKE